MPKIEVEGLSTIDATAGRKLVLALRDGGIDVSHRCGGNARCTTCRVEVMSGDFGPKGPAEAERLSREVGLADNIRLSCQIRVPESDCHVKVLVRASEKQWDPGTVPVDD